MTLHRRSIRLKGYDYAKAGAYFVTICTWHREYILGDIVDGSLVLSPVGEIAAQCWSAIPEHFPKVELDKCAIMPNHMHGILRISEGNANVGATHGSPATLARHGCV